MKKEFREIHLYFVLFESKYLYFFRKFIQYLKKITELLIRLKKSEMFKKVLKIN